MQKVVQRIIGDVDVSLKYLSVAFLTFFLVYTEGSQSWLVVRLLSNVSRRRTGRTSTSMYLVLNWPTMVLNQLYYIRILSANKQKNVKPCR